MNGPIILVGEVLQINLSTITIKTLPSFGRVKIFTIELPEKVPHFLKGDILNIKVHLETNNKLVGETIVVLLSPSSQIEELTYLETLSFNDLEKLLTKLFKSLQEIPSPVTNAKQGNKRRIILSAMQQVIDYMNDRLEVK